MIVVPVTRLTILLTDALRRHGAPAPEAAEVVDQLIDASLAGHDKDGVNTLPRLLELLGAKALVPGAKPQVAAATASAIVVDGAQGFGQMAARLAVKTGLTKAKSSGTIVALVHNCGPVGGMGYYASIAAAAGQTLLGGADDGAGLCWFKITPEPPLPRGDRNAEEMCRAARMESGIPVTPAAWKTLGRLCAKVGLRID